MSLDRYAAINTSSQMNKAIPLLLGMTQTLGSMCDALGSMNNKMDQMLDKQDQMLDKQDQMLDKQDQALGKMDQMLDKQDETVEEIRSMHGDLAKRSDERLVRIEKDIRVIKTKLGIR